MPTRYEIFYSKPCAENQNIKNDLLSPIDIYVMGFYLFNCGYIHFPKTFETHRRKPERHHDVCVGIYICIPDQHQTLN